MAETTTPPLPPARRGGQRASSFRKTDVTRLIRAALDAGMINPVVTVDPKTKKITITSAQSDPVEPSSDQR
jgi:hypothetical protein